MTRTDADRWGPFADPVELEAEIEIVQQEVERLGRAGRPAAVEDPPTSLDPGEKLDVWDWLESLNRERLRREKLIQALLGAEILRSLARISSQSIGETPFAEVWNRLLIRLGRRKPRDVDLKAVYHERGRLDRTIGRLPSRHLNSWFTPLPVLIERVDLTTFEQDALAVLTGVSRSLVETGCAHCVWNAPSTLSRSTTRIGVGGSIQTEGVFNPSTANVCVRACPDCGFTQASAWRFCESCGSRLEEGGDSNAEESLDL